MKSQEIDQLKRAKATAHHAGTFHFGECKQVERARMYARLRQQTNDPEKERLRRQVADLQAVIGNINRYLMHQRTVVSGTSVLDEMLASLAAKPDGVEEASIPQSLVDALSSDE